MIIQTRVLDELMKLVKYLFIFMILLLGITCKSSANGNSEVGQDSANMTQKDESVTIESKINKCDSADVFGRIVQIDLKLHINETGKKIFSIKRHLYVSTTLCGLNTKNGIKVSLRVSENQRNIIDLWDENVC
ncbi:MAG: hypothetical protein JW795_23765, partial [Chitinivibrionales bacterium]|nr:hypothetical protein [Chitinivibrionales bacterium]